MLSTDETIDGRYDESKVKEEAGPSSHVKSQIQLTRQNLKKKSLQVNGYGDGESRRRAWLQLLDLGDLEDRLPGYLKLAHESNGFIGNTNGNVPIDNEGWQIASHHLPDGSYDEDSKARLQEALRDNLSQTDKKQSEDDEWSVATSKRTRRRRRQIEVEESELATGTTTTNGTPTTISRSDTNTTTPEIISRETSVTGFPRINHEEDEKIEINPESAKEILKAERKARKRLKRKGEQRSTAEMQANGEEGHQHDLSSSIVHVNRDSSLERSEAGKENKKHKDEYQVSLDIRRSFIRLGDIPLRSIRRKELNAVIIGVLRRHPALNYYQGYHDVISVLLCVLVPHADFREGDAIQPTNEDALEAVVDVACRLSLHFLRDAMTENMTPTLGHLKVLRDLLRYSSSQLAKKVEQAAPLPYFALPWLLSIFAHELELSIAQLVFDYVLVRGPASVLYLSAALIEQFQGKIDAPDAAEMHHILSQLPTFISVNNLPSILEKADELATSAPVSLAASNSKDVVGQGVMGKSSVLNTWSALSLSDEFKWQNADQDADAILHGDSKEIVVNALPTPPSSDVDGDDFGGNAEAHIKDDKALVSYKWWNKSKRSTRSSDKGKQVLRNSTAILAWMGAFGAMSAAALIILYGGSGGTHTSFPFSNTGGMGSAFPAGLRVAEPLRVLLRNALHH